MMMLTIKEVKKVVTVHSTSGKSKTKLIPSVSFREIVYDMEIYTISGKYFGIKKEFGYKEFLEWATILNDDSEGKKAFKPRPSVAYMLKMQSALK
jgi:hypothetical protein